MSAASILFRCSKMKGHPLGCPFILGFGGQMPPPYLNLQGQVNCPCTKVLTFAARITLRAGAHSAPSLSPCDHARIPASHIRGRYMKKQPAFNCQAAMHLFLIAGWLTYRVCLPLALMFCLVSLILSILLIKEELQIRRRPRS